MCHRIVLASCLFALLLPALGCAGWPRRPEPVPTELSEGGPEGLTAHAWASGLAAWDCAADAGAVTTSSLVIADLSRPSEEDRLWVVDLDAQTWWSTRVAHGSGSGMRWATTFSNVPDSHQTSLGLYRGGEVYRGKHGRSLRLDGLESSNDRARERAIVVHAADYMDEDFVDEHGRAGRSWGCPALDPDDAQRVIDTLANGGALWLWHPDHEPDPRWTCGP